MKLPFSLPLPFATTVCAAVLCAAALVTPAHAQNVNPERLWLPASATHLRPYLIMAVNKALEEEGCVEVLYARLNEYRTIYEEPTFTILCQKDPKTTYNRVIKITEVEPEYFAKLQAGADAATQAQQLNPEIEALRRQLMAPAGAQGDAPATEPAAEPAAAPVAPVEAPAAATGGAAPADH